VYATEPHLRLPEHYSPVRALTCALLLSFMAPSVALAQEQEQGQDEQEPASTSQGEGSEGGVPGEGVVNSPPDAGKTITPETSTEEAEAPEPEPAEEKKETPAKEGDAKAQLAKQVSLEELEVAARDNAAVMDAERARKKNAEWQRYRARYAWAPKLQANTLLTPVPADTDINDFGNNIDNILALNIGPFFRQTANLVIPLYTFGRINRAKALAEIGVKNADLEARKAELDLIFQVRRAYYGLQFARSIDAMIKDGGELVTGQLEKMEEARNFGEADFETKDFRKLQIFSAELESRILDNQKLVTLGLAGIAYLTEQDLDLENIPELPLDEEPAELNSLEHYQAIAKKNRPEVLQLGAAMDARQEQLRLVRADYFPNLFFAANFTYGISTETIARSPVQRLENGEFVDTDLSTPPFSNPYNQLGFGVAVGLRWNLDIVQTYGKVRETEAQVERTRAQRAQAIGAIDLEIEKLHIEAEQARARIAIQGRRLEAARRWRDSIGLTAELSGQEIDSSKMADAIEPLKAYYEAKLLHMQAIVEYKIARAALAKGIGLDSLDED